MNKDSQKQNKDNTKRNKIIRNIIFALLFIIIGAIIYLWQIGFLDESDEDIYLDEITIEDKSVLEGVITDESVKIDIYSDKDSLFFEILKTKLKEELLDKTGIESKIEIIETNDIIEALRVETGMELDEYPILIVGDYILSGKKEIKEKYVDSIITTAKVDPSFRTDWVGDCIGDCEIDLSVEDSTINVDEVDKEKSITKYDTPVKVYFYSQVGCSYCKRFETYLADRFEKDTGIEIELHIKSMKDAVPLLPALREKTGLKIEKSPILIIGEYVRTGTKEIDENYISDIKDTASTKPEERVDLLDGLESKKDEVHLPSILAVILLGLIDGVNPCAFATIIFLISYLAYSKKTKQETLIIGSIYTFVVFLTYFIVGFFAHGLLSELLQSTGYARISLIIKIISIELVLVLAILTFIDIIKALKGDTGDMLLTLSTNQKKHIHKIIREKLKFGGIVLSSILIGILVSFFELACTGQVYLPTILYIVGLEDAGTVTRAFGVFQLVLYNIAFIIPLLIIFLVSYFGVSSKSLQNVLQKNTALLKVLLFLLFVGLLIYMLVSYLSY